MPCDEGGRTGRQSARHLRTDAARNRERLLAAARTVFRDGGPRASFEAVARAAGVGIGTLYRHFPTRDTLFEAVYRREVAELVELAGALADDPTPVAALRRWLHANVAFVTTKKGMAVALAMAVQGLGPQRSTALSAYTAEQLTDAVGRLMDRAVAAGDLRDDIGPGDLLRMLVALCYDSDAPGWQDHVARLLDVFVDGLRRTPGAAP